MQSSLRMALAVIAALLAGTPSPLSAAPPTKSIVNGLDDAPGFEEPEALDFAYPVPWLKSATPPDRQRYMNAVRHMFKTGWEQDPAKALAESKKQFEAAKTLCADDPRLFYGYGIILWKHGAMDEAVRLFESRPAGPKMPMFLPMSEAAVWARLMKDDANRGLPGLEAISRALNDSGAETVGAEQRRRAAMFLGRALGFLAGPGRREEAAAKVDRLAADVKGTFDKELRDEFQKGWNDVEGREQFLRKLAARPADEIRMELDAKKAAITEKIEAIDLEQQTEYDAYLGNRKLAPNLWRAALSATNNAIEMRNRAERQYDTRTERRRGKDGEKETENIEISAKERESRRRDADLAAANAMNLQAKLLALRQQVKEYQRLAARRRNQKHALESELKSLVENLTTPEQLKSAVKSLAAYVPWDLETERDRLLESYQLRVADGGK